jgi:hypothetical protein
MRESPRDAIERALREAMRRAQDDVQEHEAVVRILPPDKGFHGKTLRGWEMDLADARDRRDSLLCARTWLRGLPSSMGGAEPTRS